VGNSRKLKKSLSKTITKASWATQKKEIQSWIKHKIIKGKVALEDLETKLVIKQYKNGESYIQSWHK
jgi:hypothetical protein